ncbi:hypothetical protein [Actinokineospora spheciospongiae]|nr:hypothetical protein [Actinokineospora spheciospongiae]PWW62656.1 hypothetical protein DFQ13_105472 [Actinokineospora spheciospongiae]
MGKTHERIDGRLRDAYCAGKPHVPTSLDGLPALPVPLPPRPA